MLRAGSSAFSRLKARFARLRPVTAGALSGDVAEIRDGLKPGDWYIVRGGFNVKDGDRLAVTRREGEAK